jgi:hypothetical protein
MASDELNFALLAVSGDAFCSPDAGVSDAMARELPSAAGVNSRSGTRHPAGARHCPASIVERIGQREGFVRCA